MWNNYKLIIGKGAGVIYLRTKNFSLFDSIQSMKLHPWKIEVVNSSRKSYVSLIFQRVLAWFH